jgi:hypothetical protein
VVQRGENCEDSSTCRRDTVKGEKKGALNRRDIVKGKKRVALNRRDTVKGENRVALNRREARGRTGRFATWCAGRTGSCR